MDSDALQLLATEDAEAVARAERRLSGSIRTLWRQRRRLRLLVGTSGAVALFECSYAAWGWHAVLTRTPRGLRTVRTGYIPVPASTARCTYCEYRVPRTT